MAHRDHNSNSSGSCMNVMHINSCRHTCIPGWSLLPPHRRSSLGFRLCLEFKMQNVCEWLFIPAGSTTQWNSSPFSPQNLQGLFFVIFLLFCTPSHGWKTYSLGSLLKQIVWNVHVIKQVEIAIRKRIQKLFFFLFPDRQRWLCLLSADISSSTE